ncbi:signal peptidase complex subunit 2 [Aspergillus ruber CBS 135680]|uniref:Signal peptidase complex subunit 2 n=1 Tax=Aspergillus ruber (strain CBS 135680) TaxID=1388766 RepID=A0A017S4F4_ASPRC|nr:uncharacterized protein EURHEDRAFT_533443 [Aspergillus ruber CBS 135680]EYE91842.1 hypothetical protein EURHEDRAFT_533443 [Aspergillus ruber CBS 135680]
MATTKVPVYSSNDLKSTTDDALSPYLTTLPTPYTFTQDHTLTNIRFLLGYTAVAIAGATFYADRYLGWEATTSSWVIAAVSAYFVLNGVFTYWVWFVEGGEVFRGRRGSGELISIRSSTKKHSPLYNLRVQYKTPSGKALEDKVIETPFTTWFSADGTFHPESLREWLASEIEVLGLAAKETVKETGGASSSVAPRGEDDEDVTKRR